jgi:hypothetical protein
MNKESSHGGRRPGSGRKPLGASERLRPHSVYLTDKEWDSCQWKWSWGISGSEYVRALIHKDMEERRRQEQE